MRNILIILSAFIALTGCMANQPVNQLSSPTKGGFFTLEQTTQFAVDSNLGSPRFIALAQGRYQAIYEDAKGTFYAGPENAVRVKNGKLVFLAQGGVYLPKQLRSPAMTWIYANSTQRYREAAIASAASVDAATAGNEVQLQWHIPADVAQRIRVLH